MNVYTEIERRLGQSPELAALVDFCNGNEVTAGELLHRVDQLARELGPALPPRKSVIALCLPNGAACVASVLALWKLGHAVMPIPHSLAEGEVNRLMNNGPAAILLRERPMRLRPDPRVEFPIADLAFVRFTSGTTEDARGVLISHEAILARAASFAEALGLREGQTVLWHLDMSYHFTTSIVAFLLNRCPVHLGTLLMPARFAEWLRVRRVDYFFSLPYFFEQWARSSSALPKSETQFFVTGQALDPLTLTHFNQRHGQTLRRMYGVIEAGIAALHGQCADPQVVGKTAPRFDVKLDERGLIHIKSPGLFSGYLMGENFEYRARKSDWFDTGDRGDWTGSGELRISGRAKEMIFLPGIKFFPSEVERTLNAAPGVSLSAVFVSSTGLIAAYEGDADSATVEKHARAHLERAKIPDRFLRVERLPRTASGKIRRQADAYAEYL